MVEPACAVYKSVHTPGNDLEHEVMLNRPTLSNHPYSTSDRIIDHHIQKHT